MGLTFTTTPGQSGFECNGNERVLNTHQISRTGTSTLDAVSCPTTTVSVLDMTLNLMGRLHKRWGFGNAEYPFIAIALSTTRARSGST